MCARPVGDDAVVKVGGKTSRKWGRWERQWSRGRRVGVWGEAAGVEAAGVEAAGGEAKEDITFYFWNENHFTIIQRFWQNSEMQSLS